MINIGDNIYVPRSRLGMDSDAPSALVRTKVQARHKRTLTVDVPEAEGRTCDVPSSSVHKDLAIYVITIGDYRTETSVLSPLTSSITSFCSLLLPPDAFQHRFVRSTAELEHYWNLEHRAYSHVILIAHGSETGLEFAVDGDVRVADFVSLLGRPNPEPKIVLSLCCQTGRKAFARPISRARFCKAFIAPFQSVHGAVASEFMQAFLGQHLLGGHSVKVAFNKAGIELPGKESFRYWQDGHLGKLVG